jgi:hypothetical protein
MGEGFFCFAGKYLLPGKIKALNIMTHQLTLPPFSLHIFSFVENNKMNLVSMDFLDLNYVKRREKYALSSLPGSSDFVVGIIV